MFAPPDPDTSSKGAYIRRIRDAIIKARRQKGPTVDPVRAVLSTQAELLALRPAPI